MLLRRFTLGVCVAGLLASCSGGELSAVKDELSAVKDELSVVKDELSEAEERFVAAMETWRELEVRYEREVEDYEDFVDEVKELYDALYVCRKVYRDFLNAVKLEVGIRGEISSGFSTFLAAELSSKCVPWAKQHDDFDWSP